MGLPVVHGIIKSMGGLITVDSEPGAGARFIIYLPIIKEQAAGAEAPPRETTSAQEHIVYVDDEPFLVEIGATILRDQGYTVTGFTDSETAMRYLRQHHDEIGLVISDMTMPGYTGLDLVRQLRRDGQATPVIICTGHDQETSKKEMAAQQIAAVLLKPVTAATLSETVRTVLHTGRMERNGNADPAPQVPSQQKITETLPSHLKRV